MPAAQVLAVVDDCIAKGVKALVVISAGFGECGDAGKALEAELVAKIRAAGVRMIGPNCMGIINTNPAVALNATFAPTHPIRGRLGFLTQSGALGIAILDYVKRLNLGISTFASVGNKADVSGNDLIQYWDEDPETDVILLYLESFGNPRKFADLARRVSRRKPIVAVKAGRSEAGARASSSHTGARATSDRLADAMLRDCGVIRTSTLEELFDVATLLSHQPVPAGRRVAIVTNAGGPAILAADACESNGLTVPPLSAATQDRLRAFLPAAASVTNPVDMLASATAEQFERVVKERRRGSRCRQHHHDLHSAAGDGGGGCRARHSERRGRQHEADHRLVHGKPGRAPGARAGAVLRVPGVGRRRARRGHPIWRVAPPTCRGRRADERGAGARPFAATSSAPWRTGTAG